MLFLDFREKWAEKDNKRLSVDLPVNNIGDRIIFFSTRIVLIKTVAFPRVLEFPPTLHEFGLGMVHDWRNSRYGTELRSLFNWAREGI
jgi:hypothetical protein